MERKLTITELTTDITMFEFEGGTRTLRGTNWWTVALYCTGVNQCFLVKERKDFGMTEIISDTITWVTDRQNFGDGYTKSTHHVKATGEKIGMAVIQLSKRIRGEEEREKMRKEGEWVMENLKEEVFHDYYTYGA